MSGAVKLNRKAGAHRVVEVAITQLGKPYSEQSPAGSDGDGHLWVPGEPWPTFFDCSGLAFTSCSAAGIPLSNMRSEDQWAQHLGGVVPDSDPLLPADLGFFVGVGGPSPGHVGIVESYDAASDTIVLVNAADTELGVIRSTLPRHAPGWTVGYTRPCNVLPDVLPAPTEVVLDRAGLLQLANTADATTAALNGWTIWRWSVDAQWFVRAQFEPWPSFPLYASVHFQTKRP